MTSNILIQEGQNSRHVSRIEGVVLRQLQSALKGNDRAALAVIKMALQLGLLEDSERNTAETALSPEEGRVLNEVFSRLRKD